MTQGRRSRPGDNYIATGILLQVIAVNWNCIEFDEKEKLQVELESSECVGIE